MINNLYSIIFNVVDLDDYINSRFSYFDDIDCRIRIFLNN